MLLNRHILEDRTRWQRSSVLTPRLESNFQTMLGTLASKSTLVNAHILPISLQYG